MLWNRANIIKSDSWNFIILLCTTLSKLNLIWWSFRLINGDVGRWSWSTCVETHNKETVSDISKPWTLYRNQNSCSAGLCLGRTFRLPRVYIDARIYLNRSTNWVECQKSGLGFHKVNSKHIRSIYSVAGAQ